MDETPHVITELGARKIQRGSSSHVINLPMVAINSLGWETHDKVDMRIVDNEYIVIKKVNE